MNLLRSICAATSLVWLLLCTVSTNTHGQGCVAFHYMAPSHWPGGQAELQPREWQLGLDFLYLYADQGYMGSEKWPEYATIVGNRITIYRADLQLRYAFDSRWSATFTVPAQYGEASNHIEHDGTRHTTKASGFGDIRLVGTAWLMNPETCQNGNVSVGVGVKAPTGDEAATDTFHKPTGPEERPVDIAIQPGDGGWGIPLELSAYRRFAGDFTAYADGYYLVNPREQNKGYTTGPVFGEVLNNSVTDQYSAEAGLAYSIGHVPGLSVSLGGLINGIPTRDLVGGDEGFRRAGYAVYVEPGVTYVNDRYTFSLSGPLLVKAKADQNIYQERMGLPGGGAFADWLLFASVTYSF